MISELIHLCLVFFDKNDLYLTFNIKMVTANTQKKAVFIYHKQHLINKKLKNRLRNMAD